MDTYRSFL